MRASPGVNGAPNRHPNWQVAALNRGRLPPTARNCNCRATNAYAAVYAASGRIRGVPCSISRIVSTPTTHSVLQTLSKARLLELGRTFSVVVPPAGTKDAQ